MRFISTRGEAPALGFSDALLAGLARDGGLYVPQSWPQFSTDEIRAMRGLPYAELAARLLTPFLDEEVPADVFGGIAREAYGTFRHEAVCPLVQIGPNTHLLELFHGPTLAFKDVAMQLIARLMDHVLAGRNERATIVGATSGDTGGAAIEAFGGRDRTDIFILFPRGRVSDVQQRQMTVSSETNVFPIEVQGTFDDCQALVKDMFNDHAFRDRLRLSGVNSINWARIMAQIVYYFSSALSLGSPDRPVSFTVPTGNFGDVFAGYAAKRMGLPVERLVIATNDNDILVRALATGRYEMQGVKMTTSPSMDIQISSNFERLLFEAGGRDAAAVSRAMAGLKQSGSFALEAGTLAAIRAEFDAGRATVEDAAETMRWTLERSGYLLDPHTACALHVAREAERPETPMVVLATAHPAKFGPAVKHATDVDPALPDWLSRRLAGTPRFGELSSNLKIVEEYVEARARAAHQAAA